MSDDRVERVAQALAENDGKTHLDGTPLRYERLTKASKEVWRRRARAALAALSEPAPPAGEPPAGPDGGAPPVTTPGKSETTGRALPVPRDSSCVRFCQAYEASEGPHCTTKCMCIPGEPPRGAMEVEPSVRVCFEEFLDPTTGEQLFRPMPEDAIKLGEAAADEWLAGIQTGRGISPVRLDTIITRALVAYARTSVSKAVERCARLVEVEQHRYGSRGQHAEERILGKAVKWIRALTKETP